MGKFASLLTALFLGLIALTLPLRADIVLNGNFDANSPGWNTAPLDWTLTPASSGSDFAVVFNPAIGVISAPNSANFGAIGSLDDTISQVLPTVAGESYILDFFLAHDATDNQNDFHAIWNGTPVLNLVNASSFPYTEFTFDVVATGSSTTLAFAGREVPAWFSLDNVSVNPDPANDSTIPEPASVVLLGSVLICLARYALGRSRRTS